MLVDFICSTVSELILSRKLFALPLFSEYPFVYESHWNMAFAEFSDVYSDDSVCSVYRQAFFSFKASQYSFSPPFLFGFAYAVLVGIKLLNINSRRTQLPSLIAFLLVLSIQNQYADIFAN